MDEVEPPIGNGKTVLADAGYCNEDWPAGLEASTGVDGYVALGREDHEIRVNAAKHRSCESPAWPTSWFDGGGTGALRSTQMATRTLNLRALARRRLIVSDSNPNFKATLGNQFNFTQSFVHSQFRVLRSQGVT